MDRPLSILLVDCSLNHHEHCKFTEKFTEPGTLSTYLGYLQGFTLICNCSCHNKRREEVINVIIRLRDAAASSTHEYGYDFAEHFQASEADWRNEAIDALGDALTFLGYPNGGED